MRRALAPPARVIVRLPSWLGDFVMAEPVVRALHERFERAGEARRLSFAAPERLLTLIDGRFAGAQRIFVRGRDESFGGHDVALLLNGSWNSVWSAFRAGIPERIALTSGGRGPLLTLPITPALERGDVPLGLGIRGRAPRRLPRPFGSVCLEIASACGLEVRDRRPILVPSGAAIEAARARLSRVGVDADRGFVLVHAGSRASSAKSVPAETWRAVLACFAESGEAPIVVACAPGEEANARQAVDGMRAATLLDDPAPELDEIVALISLSRLVITADSGPRHLARALSKPCIVACGPTDPRHTADHGRDTNVVRVEVPCGPCHRELCPNREADVHACMRRIDPATLIAAARDQLLAKSAGTLG